MARVILSVLLALAAAACSSIHVVSVEPLGGEVVSASTASPYVPPKGQIQAQPTPLPKPLPQQPPKISGAFSAAIAAEAFEIGRFASATRSKKLLKVRKSRLIKASGEAIAPPAPTPVTVTGSAVYHIPKEMVENETSQVDLWIDREISIEKLRQELAAKLQITADKINGRKVRDKNKQADASLLTQIEGEKIPIGSTMIAHLRGGDDFTIDQEGPVSYPFQGRDRLKWNWRVTPKHASDKGMLLNLDIFIDPGGGKYLIDSYPEPVMVKAVIVKVRPKTFYERAQDIVDWLKLLDDGLKLLGGIVAVAGGWLLWLLKRRNGDKKGPEKNAYIAKPRLP